MYYNTFRKARVLPIGLTHCILSINSLNMAFITLFHLTFLPTYTAKNENERLNLPRPLVCSPGGEKVQILKFSVLSSPVLGQVPVLSCLYLIFTGH